jgi:hypothetical protein
VILVLAALLLLLGAVSASAATKSINGYIGDQSSNGLSGTGGLFNQPRDIAVYEGTDANPATDKIFVVEAQSDNHRVQRLDADGNFELMWGKNVDRSTESTAAEKCTVAAQCQGGGNPSSIPSTLGGEFNNPHGIAVNQSNGDVYVFDRGNNRIQQFEIDGDFVRAFGKNVGGVGVDVCTDPTACQAGTAGAGAGQLGTSSQTGQTLAVSPASGDVFVADATNRRVLQFTSSGTFVRAWGYNVSNTGATTFETCTAGDCQAGAAAGNPNGNFASNPLRLSVDSNGIVYVGDASGASAVGGANRIVRFDSDLVPGAGAVNADTVANGGTGALLSPIACCGTPGSAPLATGVTIGIEVVPDPDGAGSQEERLIVLRRNASGGATVLQEFDIPATPTDSIVNPLEESTIGSISSTPSGFGFNSGLDIGYIVGSLGACPSGPTGCNPARTSQHGLFVLSSGAGAPELQAPGASDATATTADLVATVTPNGLGAFSFEYSADGITFQATPVRYRAGTGPVSFGTEIAGLTPNTTYRVRVVALKQTGLTTTVSSVSAEGTFITDAAEPVATTLGAAGILPTSATLGGRLNPNGSATSYWFEYGPTSSYGTRVPVPSGFAGSGGSDRVVSQGIAGLDPETTYHFRLVAENPVGRSTGADRTFTTRPSASPPAGREYELVSPADKVGGTGVGVWYVGPSVAGTVGFAAHEGERFAAVGAFGSVLMDGAMALGNDWAFAERTSAGWFSHSPLTRGGYGSQSYRFALMGSARPDFSTVTWKSNGGLLRMFPEMEQWNGPAVGNASFASDWAGNWEIVAPTDPSQVTVPAGINILRSVHAADSPNVALDTPHVRGLAGPGDPTATAWPDLVAGSSNVYLDDLTAGVSDTFPGTGVRSLVNVCTGSGAERTLVPERLADGKQGAQACPDANPGRSARLISDRGGALPPAGLGNEMSADGSRLFFLSPDPAVAGTGQGSCDAATTGVATKCPAQLYVRQRNDDGTVVTRWISRTTVAGQDASLLAPAIFEGASVDGDKVFFRTISPLTADDPNGVAAGPPVDGVTTGTPSGNSSDLYMYDLPDGPDGDPGTPDADPAGGTLTRISAGPAGAGDCNVLTTSSRFLADDGGRLYFTCSGELPGAITTTNGTTAPGGSPTDTGGANLYLYDASHPAAERWRFVARLAAANSVIGACATTRGSVGPTLNIHADATAHIALNENNCVRGTADGSFVTFWTDSPLLADDTDADTADIYGYDAATGELLRLTATQGGLGGSYACNDFVGSNPAPALQCNGDGGIGPIPGASPMPTLGVVADPEDPSDRIAFFQSKSRLVAADRDDVYDVYQWRNGELSLVSTGTSDTDGAFYEGNDRTGTNVYFATLDRLSWQDHDSALDIYTARVGGGIPQPVEPAVCAVLAGACQDGVASSAIAVPQPATQASGGDAEASPGPRGSVRVKRLSAAQRATLARRGRSRLTAIVNLPGRLAVTARARIGKRTRKVMSATVVARRAGVVVLPIRLSRLVRRQLRSSGRLSLTLSVAFAKASEPATTTVRLTKPERKLRRATVPATRQRH